MAMRLMGEKEFHKELGKIGLSPTAHKTGRTQIWRDKEGNPVMAPCDRDMYPDWMLDEVYNALKQAKCKGVTMGELPSVIPFGTELSREPLRS